MNGAVENAQNFVFGNNAKHNGQDLRLSISSWNAQCWQLLHCHASAGRGISRPDAMHVGKCVRQLEHDEYLRNRIK